MPTFAIKSSFDCSIRQSFKTFSRHEAVMADRLVVLTSRWNAANRFLGCHRHVFDAVNISPAQRISAGFVSNGQASWKSSALFGAFRLFEHPCTGVPGLFAFTRSWDTGVKGRFESIRPSFQQAIGRFDAILYQKYVACAGMFAANSALHKKLTSVFDVMPGYQYAMALGRFDTFGSAMTSIAAHKQAFVKSGWRILLRSIETDEVRDLGFIEGDAVEKAITDVDIPDGDYEIALLHSSLFWKDAVDRVVRNVTIRADEAPVLGLPPVIDLVSNITDGVTRISWASNSGDYEDCEFGLWFAETPPVVTFREPDQRIAYTASELEYGVNITQSVPLWCVVMAVKGNMRGPASEIFLDWSSELPRRPDDQMAFDVFLDEKLEALKNASGLQDEGVEWDRSDGYW